MPDEGLEATFEVERPLAILPLVDGRDPDALREIGRFAEALGDGLERVLGGLEHLRIGAELCARAAAIALRPDLLDRAERLAAAILLGVHPAVARGFDPQPLGQRVDDADADAVEAARDLVAPTAELPAGVEHGVH